MCMYVCVVRLCNKTATKPSFSNSRYWHQKKNTIHKLYTAHSINFHFQLYCLLFVHAALKQVLFFVCHFYHVECCFRCYDKCAEFNELVNSLVIRTWLNDLSIVSVDFIAIGCILDAHCDRTFILLALHC